MGAFQVSEQGDLANWRLPGRRRGAIGGAADLAAGSKRVWVMTTHTTKDGEPKLVSSCLYPLTASGVVTRVYTELAVLDVRDGGFGVVRLAPGTTGEEVAARTEGRLVPTDVLGSASL
jgi:3-oxoacid CoA-transferase B subunit